MSAPRFRSHIIGAVLDHVEAQGGDVGLLMRSSELPGDARARPWIELELPALHVFLERAAEAARDDELGVSVGQRLSRSTWDLLQLSALSAPTLGEALARVATLIPLFNDTVEIEVVASETSLTFEHRIAGEPRGLSRHGNEAMLVSLLERARAATGLDVRPRECWLAHAEGGESGALERALGADRIAFGVGSTGVRLDPALREAPLRSADPVLLALLDRLSSQSLALIPAQRGWASKVCRALEAEGLERGPPELRVLARRLGTSARSLQRSLEEEATSYRALVDHVRRTLARALMTSGLAPPDVALRLGYSDRSAFARALSRWTTGEE